MAFDSRIPARTILPRRTGALVRALLLLAPLVAAAAVAQPAARRMGGTLPALVARSQTAGGPVVWRAGGGWRVDAGSKSAQLAGEGRSEISSIADLPDGWLLAGFELAGERTELALWRATDAGVVRVAPPAASAGSEGASRLWPVVVAGGQTAPGIAWLEGHDPRGYSVRWANWEGGAFGAPIEIAPPGPGSQVALSATRLEDGRTLLVWSAFDGTDDEILAAVGDGTSWSRPRRVGQANDVPDITPAVAAVPGGALIAWNRFHDGEYRVVLARWSDEGSRELAAVGPPGSLEPTFEAGGDVPFLLWLDALTDEWTLAELSDDTQLTERARMPGDSTHRPLVRVDGRSAEFRLGDSRQQKIWR